MINGRWWWWFTWSWRVVRRNQPPPSPPPPSAPADEDVLPFEEYPPPSSDEEEEEINHPTPQISNEAAAAASRSDRRAGLLPASSKAIRGLREVTAADAGEDECAVCLQDFEAGDKLRMMPCCHTFHQRCIFNWLRLSCICPLCRHTLPTQNVDDDSLGRDAHTAAGSTG
uniref:RING-type domain-containing protein n=1 Tax=Oryza meridionalis TaxID=40149 RepID=A0A0E0F2I6_9ORYZ